MGFSFGTEDGVVMSTTSQPYHRRYTLARNQRSPYSRVLGGQHLSDALRPLVRRLARSSGLNHHDGQGKLFVARRCVLSFTLHQSSLAVQSAVFHRFTAFTKKEKRSKKERKLLLLLGIHFAAIAALNTYKGKASGRSSGPPSPRAPPWVRFDGFSFPLPRRVFWLG